MRLSKNEASLPVPYPMHSVHVGRESTFVELPKIRVARNGGNGSTRQAVADLTDLVANYRSDLLKNFLDVVHESESTRSHAAELMGLVAACGVAESASPCATAMAVAADLEKLADDADGWTHPAQTIQRPNVSALYRLCAARVESETGAARQRLEDILPRLERTARLTEKAAARRDQGEAAAAQPSSWADRWL